MEAVILALFCAFLLVCLVLDISIVYALLLGLGLFIFYGVHKGFPLKELLSLAFSGIKTVRKILITFLLIGVLTGLWRAGGTIPYIITYASSLIRPSVFLVLAFWLNCLLSVLTGTAFGTAATMGVICGTIGSTMGLPMILVGGAVLSGAFFGDRCSFVSTSALLVSTLTKTELYENVKQMAKTALVPFILASALYLLLGFQYSSSNGTIPNVYEMFSSEFHLHWAMLIPALLIFALSIAHVKVIPAMIASILSSIPLCIILQKMTFLQILSVSILGYKTADPTLSAMLNGGGMTSMLKVSCIILISASFSDIFRKTGLLHPLEKGISWLERFLPAPVVTIITAFLTCMLTCNQTLSIMLTYQLRESSQQDRQLLALSLEDSSVIVSPLVPWSISCGVPMAAVGAPVSSVCTAFFLLLMPIWHCIYHRKKYLK